MSENSWGVLPNADKLKSPKVILSEQGAFLADETAGILEGIVHERPVDEERIQLKFSIECQALTYRFAVLVINYPRVEIYPARIQYFSMDGTENDVEVEDEAALLEVLKEGLQSEKVKRVIAALLRDVES